MTKTLADKVEKESYFLVEFSSAANNYQFTDSVLETPSEVGLFDLIEPTMAVDLPPNTGTFDAKPATIDLPHRANKFSDLISAQRPFPETIVKIYEHFFDPISNIGETYIHFWGRLTRATKNREGQEGRVIIEARGIKAFMKVAAGPIITHQCPWIFGKKGCAKVFLGLTESVRVISIDGTTVKTGKLSRSYFDKRHFIRGSMIINNLAVTIVSWDIFAPKAFILTKQPPESWIGQLALIEPGCDKTIEQCDFWKNTPRFGGAGYGIPEYNPVIEKE